MQLIMCMHTLGAGLYDVFHHFLGLYGVAIFFALSGYLMVELSSRQNAHAFLAARIIRIYPALLIATLFALISDPFRLIEKFNWVYITLVPAGPIFYAHYIKNANAKKLAQSGAKKLKKNMPSPHLETKAPYLKKG
ncbi:acyltransferase family protein [Ochrobactrum sp. GPK 3]